MSLAANPTRDEVYLAYEANSGYDIANDPAQAREFIRACRIMLSPRFSVKRSSHGLSRGGGGEEVELDQKLIERQLHDASAWLQGNDATFAAAGGGGYVLSEIDADFRG